MGRNGYLRSGPQQSPAQTFQHYVAVARGANLMDSGTLKRMETLAKEFEAAPDQGEFFRRAVRPYLVGLTPTQAEVTTMQTQADDRQSAEEEIFTLRKKVDQYAAAGDADEVSRLQLKISELQRKHGAVTGVEREDNERTA
jgi:hypothetical protein